MADSPYDDIADKERSPTTDTGVASNQTSPGASNNTRGNPYDHSLRNREENPDNPNAQSINKNQAGNTDAKGATSSTSSEAGQGAETNTERDPDFEEPQSNFSYRGDAKPDRRKKRKSPFTSLKNKIRRKMILLAVAALAGVISLVIAAIFFIVPLKIESIISDLEQHFFSGSSEATEEETDNLYSGYMKDILPALRSCGDKSTAVIDKNCNVNFGNSSNPVIQLFKGWRQARLENQLAENYGIEFRLEKSPSGISHWYLKTPATKGEGDDVGKDGENIAKEFNSATGTDLRAAIKSQTKWYNVMIRYKVGKLLEEKYGLHRCIAYCGKVDALAQKPAEAKYAAKIFLVDRVIQPRFAALGQVLSCILLGTGGCDGKASTDTCAEQTCSEEAGETETQGEANVEEAVGEVSSQFGSETADQLVKYISDMREAGGFSNYAVNQIMNYLFDTEGSEEATDAIPGIGELQMVNQMFGFIGVVKDAPTEIRLYSYIVNSAAAVNLYEMYSSYAGEIHTGHVTATELGSFTNSLGPGNQCDSTIETCNGPPVDGTAEAENTPLYSSLIEDDHSLATSKTYKCNDGSSVPHDKLVCPEEDLTAKNQTADHLSSVINKTGLGGIYDVYHGSGVWRLFNALTDVTGLIAGPIESGAEDLADFLVPGLTKSVEGDSAKVFESFADDIIPSPISADESGGRTFDMMSAGADVAGNDFAHTGLGGQVVSGTVAANITQQQQNEALAEFRTQSLFARLFSTNSPYSLVSKLAVEIPFGVMNNLQDGVANLINPIGSLTSSFGSLLSGKTDAAAIPTADPFGVVQYAFPASSIDPDPEAYWNQYCTDNAAQAYQKNPTWDNDTTTDPTNGQQVNDTSDQCLLIEASVGSAGATSDSSLLTPDEQADINGGATGNNGATGNGSPTDCSTATGDAKILCVAEQYNGIYYLGGGGHDYATFEQGCPSSVLASAASNSTAADPGPCATDCSGLVSVAVDGAFNQNFSWDVGGIETSPDWQAESITSVQPGDVVTVGSDTHVEIVDHYDSASGTLYTFGSHQTGQQTSQVSSVPASTPPPWNGAYRYIGPGS